MRACVFVRVDMQALIDIAYQVVRSADVKLPDVFRLPRSESFGVYGFDVGVGQQTKHFETLGRLEFFAEGSHRFGIENVPAKIEAQLKMAIDQEQHGFAVRRIDIEPLQTFLG